MPSSAILNGIWSWIQFFYSSKSSNRPYFSYLYFLCYRLSIELKLDWMCMWSFYLKPGLWTWILMQKDKDKEVVVYVDLSLGVLLFSVCTGLLHHSGHCVYSTPKTEHKGYPLWLAGDVWKCAFDDSCTAFFVFTVTFTANMWAISFLLLVQRKCFLKIHF